MNQISEATFGTQFDMQLYKWELSSGKIDIRLGFGHATQLANQETHKRRLINRSMNSHFTYE